MLKSINLKKGIVCTLFGTMILTSFAGCGKKTQSQSANNSMINNNYAMVKMESSQFEIDKELAKNLVYNSENNCNVKDIANEIYIYAVEKSFLGLNSNSTDKNVLSQMETYFLDDKLKFTAKSESIKNTAKRGDSEYTKYLFKDINVTSDDGKEYFGELSILDYGDNEVFVLAYSDSKDKMNVEYVARSLKPLDVNRITLVDSTGQEIPDTYITYEHFMEAKAEQERIEQEKNVVVEVKEEFDFTPILTSNRQFKGKYYSFTGYYDLAEKKFKDENGVDTQSFRKCYLNETKDFVLELDVINLNEFNKTYGTANTAEEKRNYLVDFYQSQANEDLTKRYKDIEIVQLYNILVSNGAMQTFLEEHSVDVNTYNECYVVRDAENQWVFVKGYKVSENESMAFAFTIDEYSNAYMLVFRYTNGLEGAIDTIIKSFDFNSDKAISLTEKQLDMYGEFLNVER